MRTTSILALLLTLLAIPASATPRLFTYSGYLRTSGGGAVTTPTALTFKLYTSGTAISPLWTETLDVTPSSTGWFSVELGTTQPLPTASYAGLFLGITVGSESEMTPRAQVTASPAALSVEWGDLRSRPAACAPGQFLSGFDADGGTVCGAGVSAVMAAAPLTATSGSVPTISISPCPAGQVLKSSGTGWSCAPQNSAFKANNLIAFSNPGGSGTTTNMLALTFTAPAAGSALVVGTGYCNVPTSGALSFNIAVGTTASENCSFACIVGFPCDRSYCAYFGWPTASPQSQLNYAVQRQVSVVEGSNTVYLNFNNTSAQTGISCYAALSATYNASPLP